MITPRYVAWLDQSMVEFKRVERGWAFPWLGEGYGLGFRDVNRYSPVIEPFREQIEHPLKFKGSVAAVGMGRDVRCVISI